MLTVFLFFALESLGRHAIGKAQLGLFGERNLGRGHTAVLGTGVWASKIDYLLTAARSSPPYREYFCSRSRQIIHVGGYMVERVSGTILAQKIEGLFIVFLNLNTISVRNH